VDRYVDAAGTGGRKKLLPGEVSGRETIPEKSAEVIVVTAKRAGKCQKAR
jgi:hypothetical protein